MSAAILPHQDERPTSPAVIPSKIVEQGIIASLRNAEADTLIAADAADTRTIEEVKAEATRSVLRGRGFTEQEIDYWISAGVGYINLLSVAKRFGAKHNALLIPYFDLDGKPVIDHQTGRPFERVRLQDYHKKGGKYRSEPGTVLHAYLPPLPNGGKWRDILNDSDKPVAITEGEFKAGQGSCAIGGLPTIGLGGVDCLVTRKGGLIPELAGMKFASRTVFIVFDAPINKEVRHGIKRAMNYLMGNGARVKVVHIELTQTYIDGIPDNGPDYKMGLDDYLKAGGKWGELYTDEISKEIEKEPGGDDALDSPLFSSLAIITGPASPAYVHLSGKGIGTLRKRAAMAEVLGPEMIFVQAARGPVYKPAFDVWGKNKHRIELGNIVVRPDLEPLSITPDNDWNSWPGMATVPVFNEAYAKIFYDFVDMFFRHKMETPETVKLHHERFLQWAAFLFQNPGVRQFTSWTFSSKEEGIGKSALLELIARIIGVGENKGAFIAGAEELSTEWTGFLNGKMFIVFNEPSSDNSKMRQKAKNLRTNSHLDCNTKYGAQFSIKNILTVGFTTNEPYAFGISEEARRDWVWEPQYEASNREWMKRASEFGRLAGGDGQESNAFRSAVLWELLHEIELSDYDHTAPAGSSRAKTRAAKASTSITDLRKDDLLQRVEEILSEEQSAAWTPSSFLTWVGDDYNKQFSQPDKTWLNGQLEKKGLHSGTTTYKSNGTSIRIWYASKTLWSDLTADEKRRAIAVGNGEQLDEIIEGYRVDEGVGALK